MFHTIEVVSDLETVSYFAERSDGSPDPTYWFRKWPGERWWRSEVISIEFSQAMTCDVSIYVDGDLVVGEPFRRMRESEIEAWRQDSWQCGYDEGFHQALQSDGDPFSIGGISLEET